MAPTVMWFRRDLRLHDNPALLDAATAGDGEVVGLFVLDPALLGPSGDYRRNHLLTSLRTLSEAMGGRLVVRRGDPAEIVPRVVRQAEASAVHLAADYGPYGLRRDKAVECVLEVPMVFTGSPYAIAPGRLTNGSGNPYKVFTPYFRSWLDHGWRKPADRPARLDWVQLRSDDLPSYDEIEGAGEQAARRHWTDYLDDVGSYDDERDRPDLDSTSRMSIPLKYGELHPRTLLADLATKPSLGAEAFRRQIAWREFCADLLTTSPDAAWKPLRQEFEKMQYDEPGKQLEAWQQGKTGFPMVDAGMRQLLSEGFVHNRVRMIVASFLVKDLQVHWKYGARWFMNQLRDGDLASNSLNWQWVAGCGADAAPYFRVFNPITQGQKFDPDGDYVRRWVPELRDLDGKTAHLPWEHGGATGYPDRIVDHAEAREEALRRYAAIR